MIIIYPVNTSFPSTRANTIQILNTANALAEAGNEVHLICRKGSTSPKKKFLNTMASGHPEAPTCIRSSDKDG